MDARLLANVAARFANEAALALGDIGPRLFRVADPIGSLLKSADRLFNDSFRFLANVAARFAEAASLAFADIGPRFRLFGNCDTRGEFSFAFSFKPSRMGDNFRPDSKKGTDAAALDFFLDFETTGTLPFKEAATADKDTLGFRLVVAVSLYPSSSISEYSSFASSYRFVAFPLGVAAKLFAS